MLFSPLPMQPILLDLKPYLDYRFRAERRLDRDFFAPANDNRTDAFNRFRVGVEWKSGKNWSGDVQYQLAHDEYWKVGKTASDESSDLNLAYAKYKDSNVEVTLGRQKINIGSERLIGALEWSMTGRAFDGVRVKTGRWDTYAFKVGVAYPKPGRTRVAGTSYTSPYGLSSLIFKHDNQGGPSADLWTLSHFWQGKWDKWTAEAEAAVQAGHTPSKRLSAWAFHGGAGYAFTKATKGFVEFNAASGGGNADTSYTFDNLLPTNHKFYGSMDLQSWRNMNEIAFGVEHQCNTKLNLKASWHSFSLRDPSDGWYGAGGGVNQGPNGAYLDATGMSGRNLGSEIDLDVAYKYNPRTTVSAGFGLFSPGSFVKSRNGGQADAQEWAYVMLQIRF